jgi:hypothetical protein
MDFTFLGRESLALYRQLGSSTESIKLFHKQPTHRLHKRGWLLRGRYPQIC